MLDDGMSVDEIAMAAMQGIEIEKLDETVAAYKCNCSRQRIENALISLGEKELIEMSQDTKNTDIQCHFCNKEYSFTPQEIKALLNKAIKK